MVTCKFCGNENNDNATLCYICGKSLVSARFNADMDGADQTEYHGVNDTLPYGANMQVATKFQSDTGGGAHSGPTQQTFGAQMMAEQQGKKKKGGLSVGTVFAIIFLLLAAFAIWYFCFSPNATLQLF